MTLFVHTFETTIGAVHAAADNDALVRVWLPGASEQEFHGKLKSAYADVELAGPNDICRQFEAGLKEYLAGKRREFATPYRLTGSAFAVRVLKEVARIPYGKTTTYGEIAVAVGSPKGSRAVGMANHNNPLPLIVPCHRVVAASGLGGYGGGLPLKERLLHLEGALGDGLDL